MRVRDLDQAPSGNFPLQNCVRWLQTLLRRDDLIWNPGQRASAEQAVIEAEQVLLQEFSPNVTRDDMRDTMDLAKIAMDLDRIDPDGDGNPAHLSTIRQAANALRAARKVLGHLTIRIAFIGWPAESHWNSGSEQRPNWVPDWRDEVRMLEAARHGVDPGEPRRVVDTTPWNQIDVEHRPGHMGEGALRLRKLHLAYLQLRDAIDEGANPQQANERFIQVAREAFDNRVIGSLS